MRPRHEALPLNERDWNCVSVQSPLGVVMLARRRPARLSWPARTGREFADWITRQFAPSNPPDSAGKRVRSRRSA